MSIVFLGDIALPPGVSPVLPDGFAGFGGPAVANLEGPVAALPPEALRQHWVWNDPTVLGFLRVCDVRAVSLANNHILDGGVALSETRRRLSSAGIASFGGGQDLSEAVAPAMLDSDGVRYALLGFGWEVIGCLAATTRTPGVSPLRRRHVLATVERARVQLPEVRLVVMMHWNFEAELYPQPSHRQLAFDAIDAGADAVVGCHSHCVQGIELYRGRPIVHGLGNWFVASGKYFSGRLVLPAFMRRQLAFEWGPACDQMTCRWFTHDPATNALHAEGSEPLCDSARVRDLTPFAGFETREYTRWFAAHRRKRKLLPIYRATDGPLTTACKDLLVRTRQRAIDAAVVLGAKGGPR